MIFGSVDVSSVYGILKTSIIMVTNMKIYVTIDLDDNDADFRYGYRYTMIAQFKQDFFNKKFSLQDQGKGDQIEALQKRIKFWLNNIDERGVPYLIIFMIMIMTMMDWIILFAVQRYFLRLEN